MEITVHAPNRIDLAGGTTDLYPLYLLMDGGCTVNAAVTVPSRVTLKPLDQPGIRIVSEDLAASVELGEASTLPLAGPLSLACRAVAAFPPAGTVEIVTRNYAPAGSGLGASSALLVAMISGLLRLRDETIAADRLIDLACNLETAVIGVPAGKQDYVAALYGGVSILEFGYEGWRREAVPGGQSVAEWLEQFLILSYTGQGRFSGLNNWEVTKAFIDGRENVRDSLIRIRDIARQVAHVLRSGEVEELPALVDEEWRIRCTLAPGVSTPGIQALMDAARSAGALASKICGAGGGGCMITLADPHKRAAVEAALVARGGKIIPFAIDFHGVVGGSEMR